MSVTAIALAADYAELQALVESSDELTPEMVADTLQGIEGQLADKLDAAYSFVRNLEGLATTCDDEAIRLLARKNSFEKKAKSIKEYILSCLIAADISSLKTATNTFTAKKGVARVIIDDGNKIPDELVRVDTAVIPDKKAIKEALESGIDVPGARIEIGQRSLQVR